MTSGLQAKRSLPMYCFDDIELVFRFQDIALHK